MFIDCIANSMKSYSFPMVLQYFMKIIGKLHNFIELAILSMDIL